MSQLDELITKHDRRANDEPYPRDRKLSSDTAAALRDMRDRLAEAEKVIEAATEMRGFAKSCDLRHAKRTVERFDRALAAYPPVPEESKHDLVCNVVDRQSRIGSEGCSCVHRLRTHIAQLEEENANMRAVVKIATKLRDEGGKNLGTVDELHYALASLGLHQTPER